MFDPRHEIARLELLLCCGGTEQRREISRRGLSRPDVEAAFHTARGRCSGFDETLRVTLPPEEEITATLVCTVKGREKRLRLESGAIAGIERTALLERGVWRVTQRRAPAGERGYHRPGLQRLCVSGKAV